MTMPKLIPPIQPSIENKLIQSSSEVSLSEHVRTLACWSIGRVASRRTGVNHYQTTCARMSPKSLRLEEYAQSHAEASIKKNRPAVFGSRVAKTRCRDPTMLEGTTHNSFTGGLHVI